MKAVPARQSLNGELGLEPPPTCELRTFWRLRGTSAYRPEQQPKTTVERPIASQADPNLRLP